MKIDIPDFFFKIPYQGTAYPGSPKLLDFQNGANCQVFVYELLEHLGFPKLPNFRSSDLWEDGIYTQKVNDLEAFDILFWNRKEQAWGAHLALYLGNNQAIHLAKKYTYAQIWELERFRLDYPYFIGAKRLKLKRAC